MFTGEDRPMHTKYIPAKGMPRMSQRKAFSILGICLLLAACGTGETISFKGVPLDQPGVKDAVKKSIYAKVDEGRIVIDSASPVEAKKAAEKSLIKAGKENL
jgi:hypothetical protein